MSVRKLTKAQRLAVANALNQILPAAIEDALNKALRPLISAGFFALPATVSAEEVSARIGGRLQPSPTLIQ